MFTVTVPLPFKGPNTGTPATWALAWFISASVIVDAESSYAIFGSTGAIAATTLLSFAINPLLLKKN